MTNRTRSGVAAGALLCLALAACDRSPTTPAIGGSYTLVAVDGAPLPAVLEHAVFMDGVVRQLRVRGRTITLVSRDSAEYTLSRDIVEPLPGGGFETWVSDCVSLRVPYQRSGNRLILAWDLSRASPGAPQAHPVSQDTLYVEGAGLRHQASSRSLMVGSGGRSWQLEYRAGRPETPICPS